MVGWALSVCAGLIIELAYFRCQVLSFVFETTERCGTSANFVYTTSKISLDKSRPADEIGSAIRV